MLGFSLVLFFVNLQSALISSPYIVYSPRVKGDASKLYTGSTLILQILFSCLTILILMAGILIISISGEKAKLLGTLTAIVIAAAFILQREYLRQICFAHFLSKTALIMDAGVFAVQSISLLILAKLQVLAAKSAYFVVGLACAAAIMFGLSHVRQMIKVKLRQLRNDFQKNWVIAKWNVAIRIVLIAGSQLYPWLLAFYYGYAAAGVLAACQSVVFLSNPILLGSVNYIGPRASYSYAEYGIGRLKRNVFRGTTILFVGMTVLAMILLAYGDDIVVRMYGVKYEGNQTLVAMLGFDALIRVIPLTLGAGFMALERPDIIFKAFLLTTIFNLIFGILLVKKFALIGVAFSIPASSLVGAIYCFSRFRAITNMDSYKLIPGIDT